MANLKFKRDPQLLSFAALVVLVVAGLIATNKITFAVGSAFLLAAFGLPGLFGAADRKTDDDDDKPGSDPPAGGATPLIVGGCLALLVGCGPQSSEAKQAEAEEAYKAQQKACVASAVTLAASRACRAKVDLEWGVTRSSAGVPAGSLVQPPTFIDGGIRGLREDLLAIDAIVSTATDGGTK